MATDCTINISAVVEQSPLLVTATFTGVTSVNGQTGAVTIDLVDLDTTVTGAELDADHAKLITIDSGAKAFDQDLNTTDNVAFANLSGTNTGDQVLNLQIVASGNTNVNLAANTAFNAIDAATDVSLISGGGSTPFPNKIGFATKPNGADFTPHGWVVDSGYIGGSASVGLIAGGYDHINNQLAGVICGGGHNFMRYNISAHSFIGGGSYNIINGGRSVIVGGRRNSIGDGLIFGFIGGGDNNVIKGGADYSSIVGGIDNTIHTKDGNNAILSGVDNTLGDDETTDLSFKSVIAGGGSNSILNSKRTFIGGGNSNSITDAEGAAILGGKTNVIEAGALSSSIVSGEENTTQTNGDYSLTHGLRAVNNIQGSHTHTARRNTSDGDCQSISFTVGNTTTNEATTKYAAVASISTYAAFPDDTTWTGVCYLQGREAATGDVYSCKIEFCVDRTSDVESIKYEVRTEFIDDFTLAVKPTINLHSTGLFRVKIKGEAGKTILWSGRVDLASVSG